LTIPTVDQLRADPMAPLFEVIRKLMEDEAKLLVAISEMVGRSAIHTGDCELDDDDPIWANALPALRPMVENLHKTRFAIVEASAKAARINIKEAEAQLMNHFSETFVIVVSRVFDGLDLTHEQKRRAPDLVYNALSIVERDGDAIPTLTPRVSQGRRVG
jgi:hypothetical protein